MALGFTTDARADTFTLLLIIVRASSPHSRRRARVNITCRITPLHHTAASHLENMGHDRYRACHD